MKEVRFRVWYEQGGYMMPVETIDFKHKLINESGVWRWFHEVDLMQSTGLKDKNGVEIYEGDIVRFKFKNETRIGFVEYARSSFLINVGEIICDNKIRHSFSNSSSEEHEVIGNVYQNKDLMEG